MSRLYDIVDKLADDALIGTGTSNGWTYKKYADGTFKASKGSSAGSTGTMTQVGATGIYYSNAAQHIYPDIGVTGITKCVPWMDPPQDFLMMLQQERMTSTGFYLRYVRFGSGTAVSNITWGVEIEGTYA